MLTLLLVGLAVVFISGAPLFTIMLGATALGTLFSSTGFEAGFFGAVLRIFGTGTGEHAQTLSTIPMFIYVGYLLAEANMADRLVRFANALAGWLPGGLAVVTIFTCAVFTVFTGASGVTIIALGGVLMPALVKAGYPERFSLGLIAGTGAVGLLFPPALPLFIYGTVYGLTRVDPENWDTRRFLFAGIVPGLVLIAMLSIVAIAVAVHKKLPRQKFSISELGRSFVVVLPELLIPVLVVVGLAVFGFGPADIAALTVVYVVLLEVVVYRAMPLKAIWSISYEAMAMIGAIFAIILTATAFTDYMIDAQVPKKLVSWTQDHVESKFVFLLAINVILLIVGTVMDIFSAIVVVLPLFAPIAKAYGIDPYHLGVIFLLNLEVGYLHPPVGLNLFLTSVKFGRPVTEVMWATVPFLITMLVALMVITYVPQLTVVPEPERVQPVSELQNLVRDGLREVGVTVREVTLVDSSGKPLVGEGGKPIVRKFSECRKEIADNEKRDADEAVARGNDRPKVDPTKTKAAIERCQSLFEKASACKTDATKSPAEQTTCYNAAVATWTVDVYQEERPIAEAIIGVTEIALVDADGQPLSFEQEVRDAAGKVVLDEEFQPKKLVKPIVDAGKPVTRTLAWCDQLESSFDVDNCKRLFISATNCSISWDAPEDCLEEKCPEPEEGDETEGEGESTDKPDAPAAPAAGSAAPTDAGSGSGSGSAGSADAGSAAGSAAAPAPAANDRETCLRNAMTECRKTQTEACVIEKTKTWINENELIALEPKLKGGVKAQAANDGGSGGGPKCSTNDASSFGILIVGSVLVVLRRRRRRIAA